jgi:tetratricopeptide (TPR) repeat protein
VSLGADTVRLLGRFDRIPRQRLETEIERRGGTLAAGRRRARLGAVGHGAIRLWETGEIEARLEQGAETWISETALLRRLGLMAPADAGQATASAADLARISGLGPADIRLLALFDIFEGEDGGFTFKDVVAAREIGRLVREGAPLAGVARALTLLMRRGGPRPSGAERLARTPAGEIVLSVGGRLAEVSGQLRLPLDDRNLQVDELLSAAEAAEDEGDWEEAERGYERYLSARPADAVARFNLANVLCALDRRVDAAGQLQRAVALDPAFAEAWYNLSRLAPDRSQARSCLKRALAADPAYADALYNLAFSYVAEDRYAEALPLLQRYRALDEASSWAAKAEQALTLCRMALAAGRAP